MKLPPKLRDIQQLIKNTGLCFNQKAMSQIIQKPFTNFFIATLFIVVCLSATPSTFCTSVSQDVKNTSVQFKMLNGSNRLNEFNTLAQAIFNTTPNLQTINFSLSDIQKIFGTPNQQPNSNTYIYYLTSNTQHNTATFINNTTNHIVALMISD